jgi:glucose/arabinose dehydrogenase
MRHWPLKATIVVLVLAAGASACSKDEDTPSSQQPGTITGRERLGWDQRAPDAAELAQYSYALYVDGTPNLLADAACGALAGETPTAPCSSSLPPLKSGTHTLELVTRVNRSGTVLESERSAPLVVTVSGSGTATSVSQASLAFGLGRSAGEPYVVEAVVQGLDRPSALARLPDGRIMIAESGGRVRLVENGVLRDTPILEVAQAAGGPAHELGLVVSPDFAVTRHVYVSYSAADAEGVLGGRVVRYREVNGTLGESAVILDGLPGEAGRSRVRIGPDGAMYAGATGLSRLESADLSSYAGKILRFTPSGALPLDNPMRWSPVISSGHQGRLDFDWEPVSKVLWFVEPSDSGVSAGPATLERRAERAISLEDVQASDIAFHAGSTPRAWRNSLFLAAPDRGCLYRVSGLSMSPPEPVVERLFSGEFGRISAVCSAEDGLYFATANGGTDGTGRPTDAVYRVRDKVQRD